MTPEAPASPFDDLAATYDDTFSTSEIGRRMRAAVWQRIDALVAPGDRVLEVNCGTGEDAIHLGRRGVHVLATDVSPAMVATTAAKVAAEDLGDLVSVRTLAIEDLDPTEVGGDARFDVVLSDFGGLNCVADLAAAGGRFGRVLRPGGRVVACVMGPVVPWEWAWYLAHGDPRRAFRRLGRATEWRGMTITYPSIGSFRRAFAPDFELERVSAVGVLLPPTYAEGWAGRHPATIDRLERWERRIAANPLAARMADHYLVELRRR